MKKIILTYIILSSCFYVFSRDSFHGLCQAYNKKDLVVIHKDSLAFNKDEIISLINSQKLKTYSLNDSIISTSGTFQFYNNDSISIQIDFLLRSKKIRIFNPKIISNIYTGFCDSISGQTPYYIFLFDYALDQFVTGLLPSSKNPKIELNIELKGIEKFEYLVETDTVCKYQIKIKEETICTNEKYSSANKSHIIALLDLFKNESYSDNSWCYSFSSYLNFNDKIDSTIYTIGYANDCGTFCLYKNEVQKCGIIQNPKKRLEIEQLLLDLGQPRSYYKTINKIINEEIKENEKIIKEYKYHWDKAKKYYSQHGL